MRWRRSPRHSERERKQKSIDMLCALRLPSQLMAAIVALIFCRDSCCGRRCVLAGSDTRGRGELWFLLGFTSALGWLIGWLHEWRTEWRGWLRISREPIKGGLVNR
jgi:hypothetical protein